MNQKVDGQIWIDKKHPHSLKYHAGRDFVVQSEATYLPVDDTGKGFVMTSSSGKVKKAIFPDDINNIVGLTISAANTSQYIQISKNVSIKLTGSDIESCFALSTDKSLSSLNWTAAGSGIGSPVYWFIGITTKSSGVYNYTDSTSCPGQITFSTPSGYKFNNASLIDQSLNIGYDNLPIIGTVTDYTVDESDSDKFATLIIQLNFSKFDSSLEWNWPYIEPSSGILPKDNTSNNYLTIRHGLYANNVYYSGSNPSISDNINIISNRKTSDSTFKDYIDSNRQWTSGTSIGDISQSLTGTDRKVNINYNIDNTNGVSTEISTLQICGTVNYKFNKG